MAAAARDAAARVGVPERRDATTVDEGASEIEFDASESSKTSAASVRCTADAGDAVREDERVGGRERGRGKSFGSHCKWPRSSSRHKSVCARVSVSYTHLTLPTNR